MEESQGLTRLVSISGCQKNTPEGGSEALCVHAERHIIPKVGGVLSNPSRFSCGAFDHARAAPLENRIGELRPEATKTIEWKHKCGEEGGGDRG